MQRVTLEIPAQAQSYDICIGPGLIEQAGSLLEVARYSQVLVVTDVHIERQWLPQLRQALPQAQVCVVSAGEEAKNIGTVKMVWDAMLQSKLDRHSLVVILGGGVLGDLAAFAASTYERGVAFAQIPTTIVAQADSSVGGKTGFDLGGLKNLIGTFAQPVAVLADTSTLATLPKRQLIAGFGEMLKHGLIRDLDYLNKLSGKFPDKFTAAELAELVATSVRIKAAIVMADPAESGERKLVNFGHTVGHAVEALSWGSDKPLLHGEAVAIGMVVEAELSRHKGYLSDDDVSRVKRLIHASGLPTQVPHLSADKILETMHADKKDINGVIEYTLLRRIGEAVWDQTVDDEVARTTIVRHMEARHAG